MHLKLRETEIILVVKHFWRCYVGHQVDEERAMFKKNTESKSAFGVSDPLKRQFMVGFCVGAVVGLGLARLLGFFS